MSKYVIVVMAYNRPNSLNRILDHLLNCEFDNDEVDLIISIDKSDVQEELIQISQNIIWTHGIKKILPRPERLGLREHVLSCGDIVYDYETLIMFEDDIVPAHNFFRFVKQSSVFYKDDNCIAGISLYTPYVNEMVEKPFIPIKNDFDVFLIQSASSWGQAWNKDMWKDFRSWYEDNYGELVDIGDMPNKIYTWPQSSWKKYFMKYLVETNKYFAYPYIGLSTNVSDVGQHVQEADSMYQVPLSFEMKENYFFGNTSDLIVYDSFFEIKKIPKIKLETTNICFDFYGSKTNFQTFDYLLSSKKYNYKIIKSYSLNYKPQELNFIFDELGNDIFFYDLNIKEKNLNKKRLNIYYYSSLMWKDSFFVFFYGLKKFVLRKISNFTKLLKK